MEDYYLATIEPLLKWIDNTRLSLAIQSNEWIIPAVQTVHILSVAVVLSSVGILVLRLLGRADARTSVAGTVERYVPWIWGGLVLLFFSGLILIIGEPHRELTNPAFQLKMFMVLCSIAIIAVFQRNVKRHPESWNREPQRLLVRLLAVATLILFFAIVVAGRWIAYLITNYDGA